MSTRCSRAPDAAVPGAPRTKVRIPAFGPASSGASGVHHEPVSTGQVACRQWSIADVVDVRFFGIERTALIATETCRINTARTLMLDSAFVIFATAQNYSTIHVVGDIVVAGKA